MPGHSPRGLVARLTANPAASWSPLIDLDAEIERRRSNRGPFLDVDAPPRVLHEAALAARADPDAL